MIAIVCFYAMWMFHRQAHPPAPPPGEVASAAAPSVRVAPVSVAPVPAVTPATPAPSDAELALAPKPARWKPAPSATAPPPVAAPALELPPMPVYVGMLKFGGKPMALFDGRSTPLGVGDSLDGGVIVAIAPRALTMRHGRTMREVPLNTDPSRYRAGTLGTPQTPGTLGTPQTPGTLGTPQTPVKPRLDQPHPLDMPPPEGVIVRPVPRPPPYTAGSGSSR